MIYQQFKKPGVEQPAPKQELVDFWMDFLVEATKKDVSSVRFPVSGSHNVWIRFTGQISGLLCILKQASNQKDDACSAHLNWLNKGNHKTYPSVFQVLILEPTKVYQPSYLSISKDVDDNTVSIWHVAPDDKVGVKHVYHSATLTLVFSNYFWQIYMKANIKAIGYLGLL